MRCLIVFILIFSLAWEAGAGKYGVGLEVRKPKVWRYDVPSYSDYSHSANIGRESGNIFEKWVMGRLIPFYATVWVYCNSGEMGFYFPGGFGSIDGDESSYRDPDGYLHGYADMKVKFDGDSWVKVSARFPGKGSPVKETLVARTASGHGRGDGVYRSTSWSNVFISGNWIDRMKKHNTVWIEFKHSGDKKIAEFALSGFSKEFRKCKEKGG